VGVKIISSNFDIGYLKKLVENNLTKEILLTSKKNRALKVNNIPNGWNLLGTGNYAAVFYHNEFPKYAVKVYRKKIESYKNKSSGINEELLIYKKLNSLNSRYFARLYFHGEDYIVIDHIKGMTLYECLKTGTYISQNIINEVDDAILCLKKSNLSSHDIHFKNIIMNGQSIVIIDVSDFFNFEYCPLWNDSKKFYKLYKLLPLFPIPEILLNMGRLFYRQVYYVLKYFRIETRIT
jgi:hypothetical protein